MEVLGNSSDDHVEVHLLYLGRDWSRIPVGDLSAVDLYDWRDMSCRPRQEALVGDIYLAAVDMSLNYFQTKLALGQLYDRGPGYAW